MENIGLRSEDYLFPRFRGTRDGRMELNGQLAVSYCTCALQLREFCRKNGLEQLTMHSGRRGGATAALECGILKDQIKLCGGWSLNSVDNYLHPVEPGIDFSRIVLK